jgi:hypothetical protein
VAEGPAEHPLAKPEFDAVTGVSTGTLIAPFAFLGAARDDQNIDRRRFFPAAGGVAVVLRLGAFE